MTATCPFAVSWANEQANHEKKLSETGAREQVMGTFDHLVDPRSRDLFTRSTFQRETASSQHCMYNLEIW